MVALVILLQTLRISIPYLLAAAGGVMSERVGIIALHLEGLLLAGAFGAAVAAYYSNNAWAGVAGAIGTELVISLIFALATLRCRARQVVVGIAINLLVIGATRCFLRRALDSASRSPRVPGVGADGGAAGLLA